MKDVYLKSTGQQVALVDAALPAGLRQRGQHHLKVIIPPVCKGAKCSIQSVAVNKLRFVKRKSPYGK